MTSGKRPSYTSVIRKILAAFLLLAAAIYLAVTIARVSFRELMGTVDKMSQPNQKLIILNGLFEQITRLDQDQRAEAIKNPHKPYQTFIDQSLTINSMIDSLLTLDWDTAQTNRLSTMKKVLHERNELFFSYLKVKANLLDNKEFSGQLDTLEAILQNDQLTIDSSAWQARKKTTTTIIRDTAKAEKADQRSALRRLFSKKKKTPVDTPKIRVQEELTYVLDTAAVARQNNALKEIEKIMKNMESDQLNQRKKLQRQELELINANSLFINQLLNILHSVEKEELAQIERDNSHAVKTINLSVSRINYLMLGVFLAAAVLIYFIWIDITRSNFYKTQLEKARDKAEELSKIKQRFLANMSHEIRTPLQSIIGFAEQLRSKEKASDEVDAIYSSSEHLLHIVNEVLDYSRISSGNFTLASEQFNLLQVVREVEASMRIQAEKKKLTFVVDKEKISETSLVGDPFRLKQILYNLLGNAIKFTAKGFVKLSINTISEDDRVRCIFEIVDTGIGIEKNEIERVFNQFEQANTEIAKTYGGTGLGLTIVKSLVEVQNGKLDVSSEPGVGTLFKIELTFDRAAAIEPEKRITPIEHVTQPFDGKVFVVDDDGLILRLCSLILKKHKINFVTFDTAQELLDAEVDPLVTHIFMDIRMPDINGVELCKRLRKKYRQSTKFFALTAHVLPQEKDSLLKEGFDNILTKPFHEKEMLQALNIQIAAEEQIDEKPNLDLLKKMTMGDEVLYQSIVVQFIEETMDDIVSARRLLSDKDAKNLREVVHKMAGRLAQLGVQSTSGQLRQLETDLVNNVPLADLEFEINKVLKRVNEIVIQIRLTALETHE